MKIGMYVRCPVEIEEGDEQFPRYFVLGQITNIDAYTETVSVRYNDTLRVKQFYDFALTRHRFPLSQVSRCVAPIGCRTVWKAQRVKVLAVEKGKEDSYHVYHLETDYGQVVAAEEHEVLISFTQMDFDPLHQLINYEFHNPTWYANRLVVSNTMHVLNNAVYGFKTLAGCRAFLLPHQIVTIVRCLETRPVRYMLADEVGLGKTIEACAIVKVLMEQRPQLKVLYVMPYSLVDQWRGELALKFKMDAELYGDGEVSASHVIVPLPLLQEFSREYAVFADFDVVVVDETHRLLDSPVDYDVIRHLSEATEHVLLLSATPIQDRKAEFLKLLALLNPELYGGMPLEKFSVLVDKQVRIQQRVYNVLSEMGKFEGFASSIKSRLVSIASELADDALRGLIDDRSDFTLELAQQAVAYVCEHYRLERRVVRNRREMLREKMPQRELRTVSYRMATADQMYNEAGAIDAVLRLLGELIRDSDEGIVETTVKPVLGAAFSSPWALKGALERQGATDPWLLSRVDDWCRAAEAEMGRLDTLLDEEPDLIQGRLVRVLDFMEQETDVTNTDQPSKLVVFSGFVETLEHLALLIKRRFGDEAVTMFHRGMTWEQLQESADLFQSSERCRVMLCDETGGEGRNFQFAEMILHIDLPWTVNALEQRIGRLDRLGRTPDKPVMSVVCHTRDTLEQQLFELFSDGMEVFTRSLSGLEIITGEVNQRINAALTEDITRGLADAKADILELMDEMREAVDDEQFFDTNAMLYRPLTKTIEQMLDVYQGKEDEVFARAMLSWATQTGLVPEIAAKGEVCVFSENRFSPKSAVNSQLIPPDWAGYNRILKSYRTRKIAGTFNRARAIRREDALFFAPGDSIFDTIIDNALNCSRGRCTALRLRAELDFEGLVMVWNIEPRVQQLLDEGVSLQLLSQFRAYLPMEQIFTIYPLRSRYADVPASAVKSALLSMNRYSRGNIHLGARKGSKDGTSRIQAFIEAYPPESWVRLVMKARKSCREQAAKELRDAADLESARAEVRRIINASRATQLYFDLDAEHVDDMEQAYEAVLAALEKPLITLDSAAFVKLVKQDA